MDRDAHEARGPLRATRLVAAALCLCILGVGSAWADDADDLATRLAQADGLLWVGLAEGGRVQVFDDARTVVSEEVRANLSRRIEALRAASQRVVDAERLEKVVHDLEANLKA